MNPGAVRCSLLTPNCPTLAFDKLGRPSEEGRATNRNITGNKAEAAERVRRSCPHPNFLGQHPVGARDEPCVYEACHMICPEPAFGQPSYGALLHYEVKILLILLCSPLTNSRRFTLTRAPVHQRGESQHLCSYKSHLQRSLQAAQTKLYKAAQANNEGMPRSELTAAEYATDDFRMFHFKVRRA